MENNNEKYKSVYSLSEKKKEIHNLKKDISLEKNERIKQELNDLLEEWKKEISKYKDFKHKNLFNSRIYKCIVWKEDIESNGINVEEKEKFLQHIGTLHHMFTFFELVVMNDEKSKHFYDEFKKSYSNKDDFEKWLDKKFVVKDNLYVRINKKDLPSQISDVLHDIRLERNVFTHDFIRMIVYPTLMNFEKTNCELGKYIQHFQSMIFEYLPKIINDNENSWSEMDLNCLKSFYYDPSPELTIISNMFRLHKQIEYSEMLKDPNNGNW